MITPKLIAVTNLSFYLLFFLPSVLSILIYLPVLHVLCSSMPTHSACTLQTQGYGGHVTSSFYALSIISKPRLVAEAGQVRDTTCL